MALKIGMGQDGSEYINQPPPHRNLNQTNNTKLKTTTHIVIKKNNLLQQVDAILSLKFNEQEPTHTKIRNFSNKRTLN